MESYEHVVKVNALAKELMKHGIVTNSEEAVRRAEATIKSGTPDMQKVVSSTTVHPADQEIQKDLRQLTFGLSDVKKSLGGFQEEIKHLKDEIEGLHSEVAQLRGQMRDQRLHQQASAAPSQEAAHQEQSAEPASREEQAQAHFDRIIRPKEPEQKPIDISKVFYFGKK